MSLLATAAQAVPAAVTDNPSADFSDTPWWLSLIKAVLIFVYLLISTLLVIWFERRVIGRMQQRPGPNRNGPFGLLQSLADGVKSMLKEDVRPRAADVVAMPSASETYGLVALEAQACGTPVLAHRVGGLVYAVLDGVSGRHVTAGTPEAWADALAEIEDEAIRDCIYERLDVWLTLNAVQ